MPTDIQIDDENKVISFSEKRRLYTDPKPCQHKTVRLDEEYMLVTCRECEKDLNPILWLKSVLKRLEQANTRNNTRLAEAQAIWDKLDRKCSFMCKSCNEVNKIDFHRLPSKKAIEEKTKLLENNKDTFQVTGD